MKGENTNMTKHRQTEKIFLLKDMLFNKVKVEKLAREIKKAYPVFKEKDFVKAVLKDFPEQELMQRIMGIRDRLREYLPTDYKEAVEVILLALPAPLDPTKTDADFGDFIYAPYSYFVAEYGCAAKHLKVSLNALEEITKRFSCEGALRDFLNNFPKETLATVAVWSKSKNYHVRRLASEGTRPNLPWAKKINIDPKLLFPILDTLHADKSRYVTRSVANHLNDLSKIYPDLVLKTLTKWKKDKKQNQDEVDFIIKHSLRTLVKQGNLKALKLLGFGEVEVGVKQFKLLTPQVKIGEKLDFCFGLKSLSKKKQNLKLSYLIYFKKANGKLAAKVFDLGNKTLVPDGEIMFSKQHPLRLMSTRTLYTGEHRLEIQVNGKILVKENFELVG